MFQALPTPTLVQLAQGSAEWLDYRRSRFNASESAAVLGLNPWQTPYQLWLDKTGKSQTRPNAAMLRGTELEPLARAAYEQETGLVMQPVVLEAGNYSASLDGMTLEGDLVLEIKCPMRGAQSDLWQSVCAGQLPANYQVQVQHQLMVSGGTTAHLWVFDGSRGLLLEVGRDEGLMERIQSGWEAFAPFLDKDTPPPLSDRDARQRDDQAWREAASAFIQLKQKSEALAQELEAARQTLVALAHHPKEYGAGVSVTQFWKLGSVDYKKIPQLKGLDLSPYRGEARRETRVVLD